MWNHLFYFLLQGIISLVSAKGSIFPLKIFIFPIQLLEGADAGCLTLQSYFYPTSLTFGDGKSGKIAKNQKLATQNFLFNMHINFPFGNI
jgi:hypothetical protein